MFGARETIRRTSDGTCTLRPASSVTAIVAGGTRDAPLPGVMLVCAPSGAAASSASRSHIRRARFAVLSFLLKMASGRGHLVAGIVIDGPMQVFHPPASLNQREGIMCQVRFAVIGGQMQV